MNGTPVLATVDAILYDDGLVYPAGVAGEPIPDTAIRIVEMKRYFEHGDIVVDTYGQPWSIHKPQTATLEPTLAYAADMPGFARYASELEGPLVLIYRTGEPRDELML